MVIDTKLLNRNFLYPAEVNRGLWIQWKPTYFVLVPGGRWTETHDWLCKNATGLWKDHIYQLEYLVGFEKEEDAIAFKLRWS